MYMYLYAVLCVLRVAEGKTFLVEENELQQMRQIVESLNNANIEKEGVISEVEKRLESVIRMNEVLAYKVTQFQSLDFDKCMSYTNEELGDKIFQLHKQRSFFARPPTWVVYSTSAAVVPVMLILRYLLISLSM